MNFRICLIPDRNLFTALAPAAFDRHANPNEEPAIRIDQHQDIMANLTIVENGWISLKTSEAQRI